MPRIEIPNWQFRPGSGDAVPPEHECGYLNGFYRPDLDTSDWIGAQRLNTYPIGPPCYHTVVYPGYGWYRHTFELPSEWKGIPIHFGLGGYDRYDWLNYRVYMNGGKIGSSSRGGHWHDAPMHVMKPDDPAYASLRFGEKNVLAIQAGGLDRREPGMTRSDLERYSGSSLLVDQFITADEPYRDVSDFELINYDRSSDGQESSIELHLVNRGEGLQLDVRYWISAGEAVVYKQITVHNIDQSEQVLLEMDLQRTEMDASVSPGGQGRSSLIGDGWFVGVRHPAGVTRCEENSVRLQLLPGRVLEPGDRYVSKVAVLGTGLTGKGSRNFVEYLERHSRRRPAFLNLYSLYGLCEIASSLYPPIELTESLLIENLDRLEAFQKQGITFDYYCIDTGWNNPRGDLKDFHPENFPNSPERALERIRQLGMGLVLWVSPSGGPAAFRKGVTLPALEGCGTGTVHQLPLCPMAEPWRRMFREATLHHVRVYGARGFKLDGVNFFCCNPNHGHLTGKYSVEPTMDALIDTLETIRQECTDAMYMLYWGFTSPWWLLHADTIYERGLTMEGATPSDIPACKLRQSVTISLDQGHDYNWETMPLIGQDSLGVWLSNTRWGNWMGKDEWQDAWMMDFARDSMMSQLWGDVSLLDRDDLRFLARMCRWTRENAHLLRNTKRILGSPWKAGPYGYACVDGDEGAIFIHNAQFNNQKVYLRLGPELGLIPGRDDMSYVVRCLHPGHKMGDIPDQRRFYAGDQIQIDLEPFEVRMLHILPATTGNESLPSSVECHQTSSLSILCRFETVLCETVRWDDPSMRAQLSAVLNGRAYASQGDQLFHRAQSRTDERDRDVTRRVSRAQAILPPVGSSASMLVVVRLLRDGICWHHTGPFEVIRLSAMLEGQSLPGCHTPDRWHEQAGAWSWIIFELSLTPCERAREARLELDAFLPRSVETEVETWIFIKR